MATLARPFTLRGMIREYLKSHSVRQLVLDRATVGALIGAVIYSVAVYFARDAAVGAVTDNMGLLITVNLALLALLFTGVVSIASIQDEDLLNFLITTGVYNTMQLQFAFYSVVTGACLLAQLAAIGLAPRLGEGPLLTGAAVVVVVMLLWSVLGTAKCGATLVRYNWLRGRFIQTVGPKR